MITRGGKHEIKKFYAGDAGIIITPAVDFVIEANSFLECRTGLTISTNCLLPVFYQVFPYYKNNCGFTVVQNIIDSGFNGEVLIGLKNNTNTAIRVTAGACVAQLVPTPYLYIHGAETSKKRHTNEY